MKNNTKEEIFRKQNKRNLELIVWKLEIFKDECKSYGMTEKTINKLIEGKEIRGCPYCFTPNMYEIVNYYSGGGIVYECSKCGKTYAEDQEK